MSLELGKTFDRNYNLRLGFSDGFYNVGVFFSKRSPFVLFSVDPDFKVYTKPLQHGIKINMFKSLEASKFCETFLNLHNFRKNTLDILNQFHSIKSEYYSEVNFIFNETLNLAKVEYEEKVFYDTLTLYGFTLTSFSNDFIFIIAERQNIIKKLSKKVVRTTGLQISNSNSLNLLEEFYNDSKKGKEGLRIKYTEGNINLTDDENIGVS